ncbi:MAG: hypothetical protein WCJ26_12550 [bacterium]
MKKTTVKLILTGLFLSLYIGSVIAQDSIPSLSSKPNRPDSFWKRVRIGGNLGFQFGNVTGITISPEVSVRAVDQLYVGLRLIYQYYNYKNYLVDTKTQEYVGYESSVYGGGLYLRYYLASIFDNFLANLFAHVEYEGQYYTRPYVEDPYGVIIDPYTGRTFSRGNQSIQINSLFVGGGYRQPVSNRVAIDFMILFNLNDTYNSPYSNPIFRLGVGVGL